MSNFLNKIPVSPITSFGNSSVPNGSTIGTNFSILQTGGFMEVYTLSGLTYTIPPATTGIIEFSGNSIPIQFTKGSGSVFSPDVLTLNSDNISSGRRKLGMLAYVYETNKIYQFRIDNYDTLWGNATGATGMGGPTVVISDFGTTVKNNSAAGIAFINAWTASTISGIGGYDDTNASWRVLQTGGNSGGGTFTGGTVTGATIFTNGLTANTISATTYQNLPATPFLPLSGGTLTGATIFTDGLTANTISATTYQNLPATPFLPLSGGTVTGATIFTDGLTANTISATTYYNLPKDVFITGGTYFQGNTIFTNSTGDTFNIFGPSNYDPGVISGNTIWTSNGNGSMNLPQITVALFDNPNFFEPLKFYSILSGTTGVGSIPALINNDTNYIIIEYNNGVPRYNVLDNDGTVDFSSVILYMIVYRADNFVHVLEFGNTGSGLPSKLNERLVYTNRFARESGCGLGLSGSTGVVTLSSGVVWNGTDREVINDTTSLGIFFRNFHSGGTWVYTTTAHTINNLYYDDGTNLVSATAGKYLVNWYFRGQELNDHLYEVVSNGQFDNILLADASSEPSLPELITSHAFLVGRIIIEVSATTGITQSAFSSVFQPSGAPGVHNDLTNIQGGLPNQYYHLDSNKYNNLALTNIDNNFSAGQTFASGLTATTISANTITSNSIKTPILNVTPASPTITISGQSLGTATDVKLSINTIPGSGGAKAILSLTPFGITSDAQSVVESVGNFDLVFKRNNVEGLRITSGDVVKASTISATTYFNLPTDIRVTGGTYSGSTIIFTNNTGGTFSVTGITTSSAFTGGTVTGATNFTGGLTANTISATTYQNLPLGSIATSGTTLYSTNPSTINFSNNNSIFFGLNAGFSATNATYSNFLGQQAGYEATSAQNSNFFGRQAGQNAYDAFSSNFFGSFAGLGATNSAISNFFGESAGQNATDASSSNFFGGYAGLGATGASSSNFFGYEAGKDATNASNSNFMGNGAGNGAANASYSTLIGFQAGFASISSNSIGSNNIIIGTNITLPSGTTNSLNLGGVLFGSNTYSDITGNPSLSAQTNGRIGINIVTPSEALHVSGNTRIQGGLSATTISATTYLNLPSSGGAFTGGTVSGATIFTGGVTADTITPTTIIYNDLDYLLLSSFRSTYNY